MISYLSPGLSNNLSLPVAPAGIGTAHYAAFSTTAAFAQSFPAGAWLQVEYDTIINDPLGIFDATFNVDDSITIPAGINWVQFEASIELSAASPAYEFAMKAELLGGGDGGGLTYSNTSGNSQKICRTDLIPTKEGDQFAIYILNLAGNAITGSDYNWMQVEMFT